jgi:hypothetical protein
MVEKGEEFYLTDGKVTFEVENFSYDGFGGQHLPGKAPYMATFIEWTRDPGVGSFMCSDGRKRLIPTFALIGDKSALPKQDYRHKVYFGDASHS